MIVKNESSCLKTALDSVIGIDEIVICDTGSEDNTIEIAKQYTDKVFTDYKWNDDFAEARNHALSKCTSDWVLIVDADEKLITPIQELKKVIQIAEEKGIKAIDCRVLHHRTKAEHLQPRLFKRCPEVFWKGAIHNYLNTLGGIKSNVIVEYAYSAAHKLDPDRALRILKKVVQGEIVVQIASIPDRVELLRQTVESLRPQANRIFVALNGYTFTPDFLKEGEYVHLDNSTGDAAKFYNVENINGYI